MTTELPISSNATRFGPLTPVRSGLCVGVAAVLGSVVAAVAVPKGYPLTVFGDALQVVLVAAVAVLAFQNFLRSPSGARVPWFLMAVGCILWTASNLIWSYHEVWLRRPIPDAPLVDTLLFVKIVPLTAALVAFPDPQTESPLRKFSVFDVFVLMVYSLYLYGFAVFAYRVVPGAADTYNFQFNVADAVANQVFLIVAAVTLLGARGRRRFLCRLYFFAAASYVLASNLDNVAIDLGRYYTGSLYDIPLVVALASFVCVALAGRSTGQEGPACKAPAKSPVVTGPATSVSSLLAMIVALSVPAIGLWLLSHGTPDSPLTRFRVAITLLAMFLLALLLSIKEDFLTAGLIGSLVGLSDTYTSIERFKSQLFQSEKLASLGALVAAVANQIKGCMTAILEASARLSFRPDAESRVQSMAGKIGQYAQRTDSLVDNMLHFAQETPLRFAPVELRPLIESALQLSRVAKLSNIRVDITQEGECPPVRGDSSQLLHVILHLISNAVDALQEAGGGTLDIVLRRAGSYLVLEFADSGPGVREPARVFEPFYTTKPVGKGTGLGLSISYGIIQQHDGEISCGNHTEGGAIFSVRLPLASPEIPEPAPTGSAIAEGVV